MKLQAAKELQYFGKLISDFFLIFIFIVGCTTENNSKDNCYLIEAETVSDLNYDGLQDTIFILSPYYLIDSLRSTNKRSCSKQDSGRILKVTLAGCETGNPIVYKGVLLNDISYEMYPGVETVWTFGDSIILQFETGQSCNERYKIITRLLEDKLIYKGFEYRYRCGALIYDLFDTLYIGEELKPLHRKYIEDMISNYRDSIEIFQKGSDQNTATSTRNQK